MISDARGGHVSPGIYTEERDVTYSAKSLGITSLGLAGETVKGPAFQAIPIKDWAEFVDYFGGTSTEKFKGNGYPKYELPYIAKSYLQESNNLNVVRVLGLSGYYAGPAWVIKSSDNYAVAVLRSKVNVNGDNKYSGIIEGEVCEKQKQEKYEARVSSITLETYTGKKYDAVCKVEEATGTTWPASTYFSLTVTFDGGKTAKYNVSLNPNDADYIYNIFSTDPLIGNAPVYIESVFDYAYNKRLAENTRLALSIVSSNGTTEGGVETNWYYYTSATSATEGKNYVEGNVPTAIGRENAFTAATEPSWIKHTVGTGETAVTTYYNVNNFKSYDERYFNYKETYRCACTPWIVSEVKSATADAMNLIKLFKFFTISDGNAANYQVKVSIQKIRPDEGLFDVWVRDFYDTDDAPVVLEKFANLSMVEGESNFIGLRIGTFDGGYEAKSKYITVMLSNEDGMESCVPCGFLGYPVPKYGPNFNRLKMAYNTTFDEAIKPKRQYFGLSKNILDVDVLNYKGVDAYDNNGFDSVGSKLTNGFHLDAILTANTSATIYVDGDTGFTFTTVDGLQSAATSMKLPRIVTEAYMNDGTIYSDINLRKFTVYPYGGFDGWDPYRIYRTNTDDFKSTKYAIVDGCPFDYIGSSLNYDPTLSLNLPKNSINSDYYAYLAGYMQFANPNDVDINVFATPGIDWKNNQLLVEDALDMVEDVEDGRGGDALYVVTTPQYAIDGDDYSSQDVVDDLEATEINSSYACTYWPWIKYYDSSAKIYINLPVTKDVVRNMAATDNKSYPWFAPAGTERGNVDCIKAYMKTTLADEDELYEGRINPIKSFAVDGVKVWGNKTMYDKESPLNRINVRRLMLRVKKLVIDASKSLIFEQYDESLEKQFRSLVDPILSDVKSNRGITDYRIVTECTPETRDQHILPAKILIKPTPALEYISISFVVYPESVEFDENL